MEELADNLYRVMLYMDKGSYKSLSLVSKSLNTIVSNRDTWRRMVILRIITFGGKNKKYKIPSMDIDWKYVFLLNTRFPNLMKHSIRDNKPDVMRLCLRMDFNPYGYNGKLINNIIITDRSEIFKVILDETHESYSVYNPDFSSGKISKLCIECDSIGVFKLIFDELLIENRLIQYDHFEPKILAYMLEVFPQSSINLVNILNKIITKELTLEHMNAIVDNMKFNICILTNGQVHDLIHKFIMNSVKFEVLDKLLSLKGLKIIDPTSLICSCFNTERHNRIKLILNHPTTDYREINYNRISSTKYCCLRGNKYVNMISKYIDDKHNLIRV